MILADAQKARMKLASFKQVYIDQYQVVQHTIQFMARCTRMYSKCYNVSTHPTGKLRSVLVEKNAELIKKNTHNNEFK